VAVCRPPGHHANADSSSGFCFFNSIAVAARYAQKNFPFVKKFIIFCVNSSSGNLNAVFFSFKGFLYWILMFIMATALKKYSKMMIRKFTSS